MFAQKRPGGGVVSGKKKQAKHTGSPAARASKAVPVQHGAQEIWWSTATNWERFAELLPELRLGAGQWELAREPLRHRLSCRNEMGRQCCWESAYCTARAFGPIPKFAATTNQSWQWRSFASDMLHKPAGVLRRTLIAKRKWNHSRTWMHMVGDSVMASTFRAGRLHA